MISRHSLLLISRDAPQHEIAKMDIVMSTSSKIEIESNSVLHLSQLQVSPAHRPWIQKSLSYHERDIKEGGSYYGNTIMRNKPRFCIVQYTKVLPLVAISHPHQASYAHAYALELLLKRFASMHTSSMNTSYHIFLWFYYASKVFLVLLPIVWSTQWSWHFLHHWYYCVCRGKHVSDATRLPEPSLSDPYFWRI